MGVPNDAYLKGFKLAFENAKRLFNAAELLESNGEYAIANSLLVLSSEEAIKSVSILHRYLFSGQQQHDFKLIFEDHKYKINTIRTVIVFGTMGKKMMELFYFPVYECLKNNPSDVSEVRSRSFAEFLEWLKNEAKEKHTGLSAANKWWISAKAQKENGLYVGFNSKDGTWTSPTSISKETFIKSKKYVQAFLADLEGFESIDFEDDFFRGLCEIVRSTSLENLNDEEGGDIIYRQL